jgi:hypothetical protein
LGARFINAAAGFAIGAGGVSLDAIGIVSVIWSERLSGCAASVLGKPHVFPGVGTVMGFAAAKVCMQIKHSTGVPSAISTPKFNIEPQYGQANCVLGMAVFLGDTCDDTNPGN